MQKFGESQATVTQFLDMSDPLSPKNAGVLFLRGLFSPSPVRFLLDYDAGTLIDALYMPVWYFLFPFALIAMWAGREKRDVCACSVMSLPY